MGSNVVSTHRHYQARHYFLWSWSSLYLLFFDLALSKYSGWRRHGPCKCSSSNCSFGPSHHFRIYSCTYYRYYGRGVTLSQQQVLAFLRKDWICYDHNEINQARSRCLAKSAKICLQSSFLDGSKKTFEYDDGESVSKFVTSYYETYVHEHNLRPPSIQISAWAFRIPCWKYRGRSIYAWVIHFQRRIKSDTFVHTRGWIVWSASQRDSFEERNLCEGHWAWKHIRRSCPNQWTSKNGIRSHKGAMHGRRYHRREIRRVDKIIPWGKESYERIMPKI